VDTQAEGDGDDSSLSLLNELQEILFGLLAVVESICGHTVSIPLDERDKYDTVPVSGLLVNC